MGLDMYLNAEKRLNKNSKIDRQYINYFNKINKIEYTKDLHDGDGLYISEYFSTRHINEDLKQLPKLKGQVGDIKSVKSDGDSYIVQTEACYWTKLILKDVLKKDTIDNWQLSYQSSW